MHDIVRDFTLSAWKSEELQQRQYRFVQSVIDGAEGDGGNSIVSVSTEYIHMLSYHIKVAAVYPLAEDMMGVQRWIVHDNENVTHQTLISVKLEEVYALAAWFLDEKEDLW